MGYSCYLSSTCDAIFSDSMKLLSMRNEEVKKFLHVTRRHNSISIFGVGCFHSVCCRHEKSMSKYAA